MGKKIFSILTASFCILLTGCSNKNNTNNTFDNKNQNNIKQQEIEQKIDEKIIFKISEDSYYVFYYSQGKNIKYETWTKFSSKEKAEETAEKLKQTSLITTNTEVKKLIKSVNVKNNFIIVEYNNAEYTDIPLDVLKQDLAEYEIVDEIK